MDWILMATGFTGAFTLVFLVRALYRRLGWVSSLSVFFSPKGGCTDALVRELQAARKEILVQAYSFTADPLTFALIEARKRGVDVEIILDKSNEVERYSDLHIFLENGLIPHIDSHHAIAHNKIMIIDGRTLVTGSFNFTNQAEKENAENLLIIRGQPELIHSYRSNFQVHKEHSRKPELKPASDSRSKAAA